MNFYKKIIRIPGKLKGLFFVCRVDRLVPIQLFDFMAHIARLSRWISEHKHSCKNDFYTQTFNYKKRESLYEQVINACNTASGKADTLRYVPFNTS